MQCIETWADTHSRVSQLFTIQDRLLAFTTRYHGISFYNFAHSQCEQQIPNLPNFDATTEIIALHHNGELLVYGSQKSISLVDLKTATTIQSITLSNDTISALSFHSTKDYLLVGTDQGRLLHYKCSKGFFLARLHSFKKAKSVRCIAFYKDLIASGSIDGTLCIVDLYTKKKKVFKATHSSIDSLIFLDERKVLVGSGDGELHLYDLQESLKNFVIHTALECISQIIAIKEGHYALLHSKSDQISLVDLHNKKLLVSSYLQTPAPIETMLFAQEALFVALSDSRIIKLSVLSTSDLYEAMLHNQLDKAYKLVEHNPLLQSTSLYKQLLQRFDIAYKTALQELEKQHLQEALSCLEPYTKIVQMKLEVQSYIKAFKNYARFCDLVIQERYALAYTMALNYPMLQKTSPYKEMEKAWRDALLKAQKSLLASKNNEAKDLLEPYQTLPNKKDLIKLLLQNNKIFVNFLKASKREDPALALDLAQQYPSLQKLPSYKTLLEKIDTKLLKIKTLLQKGHLDEAQRDLELLRAITQYNETLEPLHKDLLTLQTLYNAYEKSDFIACYEILDRYPWLHTTQLAELLERHWTATLQICEEYALQANVKGIKDLLKELLFLPSRREKIGDLLRLSFLVKITQLLRSQLYHNAQSIIYSYIDIFGIDTEIKEYMQQYELYSGKTLAIIHDQGCKKRNEFWIDSPLVN